MLLKYVLVCFSLSVASCENGRKELRAGVIDKITDGWKMAQQYLGSESVALKVADFVVRAFQTMTSAKTPAKRPYQDGAEANLIRRKPPAETFAPTTEPFAPLRSVVKLLGMEPAQISAVAVNAIIFIAQMISTLFTNRNTRHDVKNVDINELILTKKSKNLQELLNVAKNDSLPEMLTDLIKLNQEQEENSCVKLLICKITPFITKMQKAVFGMFKNEVGNEIGGKTSFIYRHLPTKRDINENGERCEKLYPKCLLK